MDLKVITLDDNKNYVVLSSVSYNNKTYLIMANELDCEELCIRKVIKDENKEDILVYLDSEEEFNNVLKAFKNKDRKE